MKLSEKWYRMEFLSKGKTIVRYIKAQGEEMAAMKLRQLYPGGNYSTLKVQRCWNSTKVYGCHVTGVGIDEQVFLMALNPEHVEVIIREDHFPKNLVQIKRIWQRRDSH